MFTAQRDAKTMAAELQRMDKVWHTWPIRGMEKRQRSLRAKIAHKRNWWESEKNKRAAQKKELARLRGLKKKYNLRTVEARIKPLAKRLRERRSSEEFDRVVVRKLGCLHPHRDVTAKYSADCLLLIVGDGRWCRMEKRLVPDVKCRTISIDPELGPQQTERAGFTRFAAKVEDVDPRTLDLGEIRFLHVVAERAHVSVAGFLDEWVQAMPKLQKAAVYSIACCKFSHDVEGANVREKRWQGYGEYFTYQQKSFGL
jgi:hypothetical protein